MIRHTILLAWSEIHVYLDRGNTTNLERSRLQAATPGIIKKTKENHQKDITFPESRRLNNNMH